MQIRDFRLTNLIVTVIQAVMTESGHTYPVKGAFAKVLYGGLMLSG
jgi:hypothetical protein